MRPGSWDAAAARDRAAHQSLAKTEEPEASAKENGAVAAAIFGLMGLLIAFTFSGAASRFDERRHLIVQEANAIGTFYLRLDLLPAESRGRCAKRRGNIWTQDLHSSGSWRARKK
jgi:hypothetical protein